MLSDRSKLNRVLADRRGKFNLGIGVCREMEDGLVYTGSGQSSEELVGRVSDGDLEDEHVMSEVHLGCPSGHSGSHISCFSISVPPGKEVALAYNYRL